MKKIYSTIVIFIGIGLGAYIFAQQNQDPDQDLFIFENHAGDTVAHQQDKIEDTESWYHKYREEDIRQFLQKYHSDGELFDLKGMEGLELRLDEFFNKNIEKDIERIIGEHEKLLKEHLENFRKQLYKLRDQEKGEISDELEPM